ncbi:MAG: hypothetical protein M3378_02530 [Actinomycetota bacterium]|nr:hypothetical protein [Actinomycetota bacterium]MDQ3679420.1 hypothetical protein [Actinomycetota bacterium]
MPRWINALAVPGLVLLAGGCGSETGGARRDPQAVVRSAPDRTLREATAQVEAAAPDASSAGRVRFPGSGPRLQLTGPGAAKGYPELGEPLAVVDLVRGALEVVSYGGTAVREASTFRYETVIDVDLAVGATPEDRKAEVRAFADRLGAPAFYADVWLDGEGRIRRVQVPVEKTPTRPRSRQRSKPELITVDFYDFGK